ncbi:MAG: hypothetical protein KTV45_15165 [Acidimicrobiia bacterium]|nr:hypothetical protein [Acidimicrobiia bacterium]
MRYNKRGSLFAAAVLLVLAAGCREEPATFLPVETTTPTTFDTTETTGDTWPVPTTAAGGEQATIVTAAANDDSEQGHLGRDGSAGNARPETQPGGRPVVVNPPPSDDLLGVVPFLDPGDAVSVTEKQTVLTLMPTTAEGVIGWVAAEAAWNDNYEGTVDLVLHGWVVEHQKTDANTVVVVTMFFGLEGNYVLTGRHPVLMSWMSEGGGDERPPFRAVRYPADSEGGELLLSVDAEWIDPTVGVPVKPGEHREISARWAFPGDTDQFVVTAASDDRIAYVIYPQDPGVFGDVADRYYQPRRATPSAGILRPPCNGDCAQWGVPMETGYVWAWERDDVGWDLLIHLVPYPDPSEMSNVDIRVWHDRSDEVHYPTGDAWKNIDANQGVATALVEMPIAERPLYVDVTLPSGRVLTWKTVAPLRDKLFSNLSWDWQGLGDWAQTQAVWAADRICWAYWTGNRDPADAVTEPVYIGAEEPVTITPEMIDWVTQNVC